MYRFAVMSLCFLLIGLATVASAETNSNLTLSLESVPVKSPSGQSLLQRLNVQVNSAWNKFKCQFYTKATVPVAKMLNVRVPASLEIPNITNCGQLNVMVHQLTNSSLPDLVAERSSQQKVLATTPVLAPSDSTMASTAAQTKVVTSDTLATTAVTTEAATAETKVESSTVGEETTTTGQSETNTTETASTTTGTETTTAAIESTSVNIEAAATEVLTTTVTSTASSESDQTTVATTTSSSSSSNNTLDIEPNVKPVVGAKSSQK